jgi:hypothetical protein
VLLPPRTSRRRTDIRQAIGKSADDQVTVHLEERLG